MSENPYKAPQAELRSQRPKLLRTVATGALWGMAAGIAFAMFAIYWVIYEDGEDAELIYWPGMLLVCLVYHVLPLTAIGSAIALVFGLVRKIVSR